MVLLNRELPYQSATQEWQGRWDSNPELQSQSLSC